MSRFTNAILVGKNGDMIKREQIWTNCPRCKLSWKGSIKRCPQCNLPNKDFKEVEHK